MKMLGLTLQALHEIVCTMWAFPQFLTENILMGVYGRVMKVEKNELILQNYVTLYIF